MSILENHWHKIVALLMHEFEITSFEISARAVEEFKREHFGKNPTVTWEESDGVITIRLLDGKTASERVQ